jgi:hypothetical protein
MGRCTARREQAFEEAYIVLLRAPVADNALYVPGGNIKRRDQALRPMALVFVFPPLDLARLHRQARRGPFQGLHAAHLVDRHRADALLRHLRRLQVNRADVGGFRLELRIGLGREPAPYAVRLKRGLF